MTHSTHQAETSPGLPQQTLNEIVKVRQKVVEQSEKLEKCTKTLGQTVTNISVTADARQQGEELQRGLIEYADDLRSYSATTMG